MSYRQPTSSSKPSGNSTNARSNASSSSSSSSSSTSSSSASNKVMKLVRQGGSGQSQLALRMKAETPTNGRMPSNSKATTSSTTHKIIIPVRSSNATTAAVGSSVSSTSSKSVSKSTSLTSPSSASSRSPSPSASSGSSASSISVSTSQSKAAVASPSKIPPSNYISPTSYDYPSGPSITATPNGISLDLSGDNKAPQLLAVKNRSDRLRDACLAEDLHEVVNLLGAGTDPNGVDTYGNSALMLASSTGNVDIVDELLSHGANVHLKDKYGQTALIFACSKAHYAVAKLLVERKAGVNVQTMHGQTALMKVCYVSHPHTAILAELLLTHYAKPDLIESKEGSAAAHIAAVNDHMELLEILAHYKANLNLCRKSDGKTALHLAAEKASFTMVAKLIGLGANPELTDGQGRIVAAMQPLPASGQLAPPPLADFKRKLDKAITRGFDLREEHAKVLLENEQILARIKQEKLDRIRQEKIAASIQDGFSPVKAQVKADEELGGGEEKTFYIDEEGNEHYSRPSSARMSYSEMKARTYKPKLDPTSVFGGDDSDQSASPAPPAKTWQSASAAAAPPSSYSKAMFAEEEYTNHGIRNEDEAFSDENEASQNQSDESDGDDGEHEMKMLSSY